MTALLTYKCLVVGQDEFEDKLNALSTDGWSLSCFHPSLIVATENGDSIIKVMNSVIMTKVVDDGIEAPLSDNAMEMKS